VATFYLLPPRPLLADRFAEFIQTLLPGLDLSGADPTALADLLAELLAKQSAVFLVHREELPGDEDTIASLRDGFGAETGDEVVEVRPGTRPGELTTRRYRLAG
jgi:hypothetical protein